MTLKEAIERSSKTYHGKICGHHPELGGQRRTKNRHCTACKRDYNRLRARRIPEEKTTGSARADG